MSKYKYSRERLVKLLNTMYIDWDRAESLRKAGIDRRGIDLTTQFDYIKQCCIERCVEES